VEQLAAQLGPIGLGKLNRQHSYIRLVGERLLRTRQKVSKKAIRSILRTLIEQVSFHGHAISRNEAKELGLHVEAPSSDIEGRIWELYLEFEKDYALEVPINEEVWLRTSTADIVDSDDVVLAGIESSQQTDNYVYKFRFRRIREMPANITIQLQIQGASPADPLQQAVLQRITQHAIQQAAPAVQAALAAQCPIREVRKELLAVEWKTVWKR
jgi:hypothetical protein